MIKVESYGIGEGLEMKDIYLSKDGEEGFVGLHETGFTNEKAEWCFMEAWGNYYDKNKKFICSAFRVFGPIEEAAEDFLKDGYVTVEWMTK